MSRLIDADELLEEINIWCECVDGACLLKNAPTVKAIPLDRIKKAREEIDELDGEFLTIYDGTNKLGSGKYVYIEAVLEILDKLIESEVKKWKS